LPDSNQEKLKILLTGATGYVGGRLLPLLEESGHEVCCMSRHPENLRSTVGPETRVVFGDALDGDSLLAALEGIHTAYYFVHSMGSESDFEKTDRKAAELFAQACSERGVKRIVYLGGLGNPDHDLSKHLRSRQEIGDILRTSTAAVIEFRASIIIGSGSLSFEMIRALTERLPIMICPKWVRVLAQPIAIEDVLSYLVEALNLPISKTAIFEIGGPDQLSYGDIMQLYAKIRGLRRFMIPVPLLTPYLSSLWLGLITPLYARIGRKLVESMRNPTLVSNNVADRYFAVRPRSTQQAIERALVSEDQEFAVTRWSDALSASGTPQTWGGIQFGTRLVDSRTRESSASPQEAFAPIQRIGGKTGWYRANGLWRLRGWLDLLFGGVGMRRGRRHPVDLAVGDTVDFWRVEAFEPDRRLRLAAEMRLPGRAWLEFEVQPAANGSTIRQTAEFDPVGLAGLAYWYAVFPFHEIVFEGMLRNIVAAGDPSYENIARPSLARQFVGLICWIVLCFGAAAIGGYVTSTSVGGWFQTLNKPAWNPPDWLFGPVWTTLYLMMAIAAWLVWRRCGWRDASLPLLAFLVQLVLNVCWSILFFGLQSPGLAFAEILILWLAIGTTTLLFREKSQIASLLLLPYLAWTTFAACLNFAIWRLNG
jgi:tryptophan-rich sensory protein/uncharacterized protein YbjT (DUF2867 family)